MPQPRPLPDGLGDAFTVKTAIGLGVTRRRLRALDLEVPFYGVRARADVRRELEDDGLGSPEQRAWRSTILRRIRQYQPRMLEHEFFSHTTGAVLWGAPLPALRDVRIHVSVPRPRRAPRSRGVLGHELDPRLITVVDTDGYSLTSPASTWATLGSSLHPYDLVAVGDHIVRIHRIAGRTEPTGTPLATVQQLEAAVFAGRRPGVRALREALPRIRTGSASRLETWTRLILEDAGLPEPDLNYDVHNEFGLFLGCVDLAYPRLRVAIEYEGDQHWMDRDQFTRDIDRLERLSAAGWRVVRVTAEHVFDARGSELVRRTRAALRARGWRG